MLTLLPLFTLNKTAQINISLLHVVTPTVFFKTHKQNTNINFDHSTKKVLQLFILFAFLTQIPYDFAFETTTIAGFNKRSCKVHAGVP